MASAITINTQFQFGNSLSINKLFKILESKCLSVCFFIHDEFDQAKSELEHYRRKVEVRKSLAFRRAHEIVFFDGNHLMKECANLKHGSEVRAEYLKTIENTILNVPTLYILNYHVISGCTAVTESLRERMRRTAKGERLETVIESKKAIDSVPTAAIFDEVFVGQAHDLLRNLEVSLDVQRSFLDWRFAKVKLLVVENMKIVDESAPHQKLSRKGYEGEFLRSFRKAKKSCLDPKWEAKFRMASLELIKRGKGDQLEKLSKLLTEAK